MTTTHEPLNFPFDDEYDRLNVPAQQAGLADGDPLVRVHLPYGGDGWLARRYEDVKVVLADPRFSRAVAFGKDIPRSTSFITDQPGILDMDPPDHTRLRKLTAKAFTARRVELLRPRTQEIIDGLLDGMVAAGPPTDLMSAFSWPLPITVICELLGVPVEDRVRFRVWTDKTLAITAFSPEDIFDARDRLREYIAGLIEERRNEPRDDLLTALVKARDEEDRLSELEMVQFGVGLLVAGHETTANQFGNFMYMLLTHPDELAKLRADPALVDSAVEEMMRYTPLGGVNSGFPRIALEDLDLGGVTVRAGEAVFVDVASANRDPRVFDNPDRLDVARQVNPHIGFGHGAHHCLGAQLARLELRMALTSVLHRFPDLAFAADEAEISWKQGRAVRGLEAMPVTWSEVRE
ncbi:cytochrome P450 [Actinocrispum wychmicini]|uniref:Cytochrome P450 n=1 Tax=Actinocrispum wychmicini TaxID=1213861 RepID=A0A4R2J1X2_9PSEU|nr:cytochrome P450 [Actinocrispum wychmicini]TCO50788.1 cytochrome P450 [Actinocrispum wychmicini]